MLTIENLNVSYSHLQVLWDVSLQVSRGEVVTLIGSNGAGKSTLVSTIFGLNSSPTGRILLRDENILGLPTYEIVRRRLSLVPEKRELFPRMTVRENLELGAYVRSHGDALDHVFELFPILKDRQAQNAGTLSGGEQQMLAIGRCLMADPEIIVLDEPSLGLSPKLVHRVLGTVQRLNEEGLTILLVEQNVRRALEISHRGYVLESGRVTKTGPAEELLHDDQIKEAYLGM